MNIPNHSFEIIISFEILNYNNEQEAAGCSIFVVQLQESIFLIYAIQYNFQTMGDFDLFLE